MSTDRASTDRASTDRASTDQAEFSMVIQPPSKEEGFEYEFDNPQSLDFRDIDHQALSLRAFARKNGEDPCVNSSRMLRTMNSSTVYSRKNSLFARKVLADGGDGPPSRENSFVERRCLARKEQYNVDILIDEVDEVVLGAQQIAATKRDLGERNVRSLKPSAFADGDHASNSRFRSPTLGARSALLSRLEAADVVTSEEKPQPLPNNFGQKYNLPQMEEEEDVNSFGRVRVDLVRQKLRQQALNFNDDEENQFDHEKSSGIADEGETTPSESDEPKNHLAPKEDSDFLSRKPTALDNLNGVSGEKTPNRKRISESSRSSGHLVNQSSGGATAKPAEPKMVRRELKSSDSHLLARGASMGVAEACTMSETSSGNLSKPESLDIERPARSNSTTSTKIRTKVKYVVHSITRSNSNNGKRSKPLAKFAQSPLGRGGVAHV